MCAYFLQNLVATQPICRHRPERWQELQPVFMQTHRMKGDVNAGRKIRIFEVQGVDGIENGSYCVPYRDTPE